MKCLTSSPQPMGGMRWGVELKINAPLDLSLTMRGKKNKSFLIQVRKPQNHCLGNGFVLCFYKFVVPEKLSLRHCEDITARERRRNEAIP